MRKYKTRSDLPLRAVQRSSRIPILEVLKSQCAWQPGLVIPRTWLGSLQEIPSSPRRSVFSRFRSAKSDQLTTRTQALLWCYTSTSLYMKREVCFVSSPVGAGLEKLQWNLQIIHNCLYFKLRICDLLRYFSDAMTLLCFGDRTKAGYHPPHTSSPVLAAPLPTARLCC